MSSKGNLSTEYREGHSISVPCIGLCIVFFLFLDCFLRYHLGQLWFSARL